MDEASSSMKWKKVLKKNGLVRQDCMELARRMDRARSLGSSSIQTLRQSHEMLALTDTGDAASEAGAVAIATASAEEIHISEEAGEVATEEPPLPPALDETDMIFEVQAV